MKNVPLNGDPCDGSGLKFVALCAHGDDDQIHPFDDASDDAQMSPGDGGGVSCCGDVHDRENLPYDCFVCSQLSHGPCGSGGGHGDADYCDVQNPPYGYANVLYDCYGGL